MQRNFIVKPARSNPKDRIDIVLGDDKQDAFYPQMKLERWDNEVNLSVRLKDFGNFTKSEKGNVVHLKNHKKEVKLYELEPGDKLKDGGFEFEVILNEKPKTNVVEFSLNTKGLDFYYQPELTKEEKERGAVRSENVVGSYAVYASEQKINRVGGKEYKCGKVCHIYRPRIEDSAGNWCWGELKVDGDVLSVTIPQQFLDGAVYPVKHAAGATFGYESEGASDYVLYNPGNTIVNRYSLPADFSSLDKVTTFIKSDYGDAVGFKGCFWLNSDISYVASSLGAASSTTTSSSFVELDSTYASSPSLTPSTDYWLGSINNNGGGGSHVVAYDSGWTADYGGYSINSNTAPTDLDAVYWSTNSNHFSVYATYTAGGGGGPAGVKTINGVAIADVKTINGVAIADVKTINNAS